MRKYLLAVAAVASAVAMLSGCNLAEPNVVEGKPTTSVKPTVPPPPDDATTAEPVEEDPADKVGSWGETASYDDVDMTVYRPEVVDEPYAGETWESLAEWDDSVPDLSTTLPIKISMQVKNTSSAVVDPSLATMTLLAGEDEVQAECFGEDVECGTMLTKLQPGRSVKMAWSFYVPKAQAGDLTVEVAPGFDYDSVTFVGAVK